MNENRCVCCGAVIPEGTMVCRICSGDVRKQIEETRPGETICLSYEQCQQLLRMPEPRASHVVCCKDCKYGHQLFADYVSCEISQENESGCHASHKPDWFCADGERK